MNPIEYILPLCTFAGTLIVLGIGFIYNNSRISDLREDIDHRFKSLGEIVETKLALHQEIMLTKFAELDNRLTRIESHLNLK